MIRALLVCLALAIRPLAAGASEPPRSLRPQVCPAEQQPSVTSLAVPRPVRDSARRADLIDRTRAERSRRRASPPPWLVVAIAAAAISLAVGPLLL